MFWFESFRALLFGSFNFANEENHFDVSQLLTRSFLRIWRDPKNNFDQNRANHKFDERALQPIFSCDESCQKKKNFQLVKFVSQLFASHPSGTSRWGGIYIQDVDTPKFTKYHYANLPNFDSLRAIFRIDVCS